MKRLNLIKALLVALAFQSMQAMDLSKIDKSNVNKRLDLNRIALHLATIKGDLNSVISLLELNADVNALDDGGNTPLHYAAHFGHELIANALINKGANKTLLSNTGKTASDVAREQVSVNFANMLKPTDAEIKASKIKAPAKTEADAKNQADAKNIADIQANGTTRQLSSAHTSVVDVQRQLGQIELKLLNEEGAKARNKVAGDLVSNVINDVVAKQAPKTSVLKTGAKIVTKTAAAIGLGYAGYKAYQNFRKGNITKEGIKSFFRDIYYQLAVLYASGFAINASQLDENANMIADVSNKGADILTQEAAAEAARQAAEEAAVAAKLAQNITEVTQGINENFDVINQLTQVGQKVVEAAEQAAVEAQRLAAEKAAEIARQVAAAEAARQAAQAAIEAERLAVQAAAEKAELARQAAATEAARQAEVARQAAQVVTPVVAEVAEQVSSEDIINLDI